MTNDNDPHFGNPNHWRQRANEARGLAKHLANPEARQAMLRAAEHYESLAQRAEEPLARVIAEQTKPAK
jgi:hypothetical protein